jgi:hypothetical protein
MLSFLSRKLPFSEEQNVNLNKDVWALEEPENIMSQSEKSQGLVTLFSALLWNRKATRNKWQLIKSIDLTGVISRVSKENPEWLPDRLQTALSEYQKWMAMCALLPGVKLGMCSTDVDEVWHAHILYTRDYAQFCDQIAGRFIHHQPTSDEERELEGNVSSSNTRTVLKFCFGPLSQVWQERKPTKCDSTVVCSSHGNCHKCECQCNCGGS